MLTMSADQNTHILLNGVLQIMENAVLNGPRAGRLMPVDTEYHIIETYLPSKPQRFWNYSIV